MNHVMFFNILLDCHSTKEHVGRCDSERELTAHGTELIGSQYNQSECKYKVALRASGDIGPFDTGPRKTMKRRLLNEGR